MMTANNIALKFNIPAPQRQTEICFGPFLEIVKEQLQDKKCNIALITDEVIEKLYGKVLKSLNVKIFSFPAGEQYKTRKTKEFLEDALFAQGFGKDSLIIALGGGVVLDTVGFVASTFCRGVALILIPTTLLAMVDVCLGGKTSINTTYGKNLIGSFYFPSAVIIDSDFLHTLPSKQIQNGTAEIIKYGLIRSPSLFEKLEANAESKDLILECLAIKQEVIEADPFETKGLRRILNFGHTIGHAIETIENYNMEHGQAIAIGMILESYISWKLNFLSENEYQKIVSLFNKRGFPLKLSRPPSLKELLSALSQDKKAKTSKARFVLLKTIGEVVPFDGDYCTHIEDKLIEEAMELL